MPVSISNPKRRQIPRDLLSKACQHTLDAYDKSNCDVSLVISNDQLLHELNLQYRGMDKPTDVLSFSLISEDDSMSFANELPNMELGEIYISYQTAQRQAINAGHSVENEIVFLAVHGVLHLLGYNDDTEDELAEMMRLGHIMINEVTG